MTELAPPYFDHHATTPVDPRVFEAMRPWLTTAFGNPDSRSHRYGRAAREAVEDARARVASLLSARSDEIVFTSGATESNALAILGTAPADAESARAITQATEHRSVLEPFAELARRGVHVDVLTVDALGSVSVDAVVDALRVDTRLVSVMLANNEIGTAQPIDALAALCDARGVPMHVDAAQGLGYLALDVRRAPVDLVSLSAHKMYGPQGVGALFVRRFGRVKPRPMLLGGGQEGGLRSGTSNVAGIVGFGVAAQIMHREGAAEAERLRGLRDALAARLLALPGAHRNGEPSSNHPGNLSIRFDGFAAARLLLELEPVVALSTGSACSSGGKPSHVLEAIGLPDDARKQTLRFGLGRSTTADEVERVAAAFEACFRANSGSLDDPGKGP